MRASPIEAPITLLPAGSLGAPSELLRIQAIVCRTADRIEALAKRGEL